ncbi:MAG: rhodanese-like domain-containing protein [Gammaproteobacteria bacterium]|jgi:rhodanese-related sulfurtransferase
MRTNLRLTISLLVLLPLLVMADDKPIAPEHIDGVSIVTAEQAIELILEHDNMPIIDSRKKAEYLKGHIEGAVSLLDTEMTQADMLAVAPDKDARILFYCNGVRCMRSSNALRKAQEWGYSELYWFRGGWKEWSDKRLPVVTK